jgi:hypothetical protein
MVVDGLAVWASIAAHEASTFPTNLARRVAIGADKAGAVIPAIAAEPVAVLQHVNKVQWYTIGSVLTFIQFDTASSQLRHLAEGHEPLTHVFAQ